MINSNRYWGQADAGTKSRRVSLTRICIYLIVRNGEIDHEVAKRERYPSGDANERGDAWIVGPREPEESNGDTWRCHHGRNQSLLRRDQSAASFGHELVVPDILRYSVGAAEHETNCDAHEGQTADALRPPSLFLEDYRKCLSCVSRGSVHTQRAPYREKHIQCSVNDSVVDSQDEQNRLEKKQ